MMLDNESTNFLKYKFSKVVQAKPTEKSEIFIMQYPISTSSSTLKTLPPSPFL